jgi:serine/threonine protein kinase
VQQIAGAALYLHESGLVHSNISSHAILIREAPFAVKLSSFELTTEILPRKSLGKIYHVRDVEGDEKNLMMNVPADAAMSEKYYKLSKQHFYNRTSLPVFKSVKGEDESDFRLPYSVVFRRMFSMHYYQPPELLIPSNDGSFKNVLPTTRSDTFGLALLLWESLNHCVPFVLYNHDELVVAYKKNDAKLPLLDKSCSAFMEIFDSCLRVNSDERIADVNEFMVMLDEVQRAGDGKKITKTPEKTFKNFKNAKISEKHPEKIYFTVNDADPVGRIEHMLTTENLLNMKIKDASRISDTVKSSEIEAHLGSFNAPGILQYDSEAMERIRRTVEDQRIIAPKKPTRKREEEFNMSKRSQECDSTMYQSFFDFNRLHTPKIDKDGIYERTSTLKKRLKAPEDKIIKKSVKGLFERPETFDKMNNELNQIPQTNFMDEIVQELRHDAASFLNTAKLHDQSQSFEELRPAPETPKIKRSESASDYRFSIGEFSLPKTPIARQNKIRRNAWLSDSKKPSGGRISDMGLKQNKSGGDLAVNNSPGNHKQYNVSIKIHKNDLDELKSPKVNNFELNSSSYGSDINKKYYPMMPEMLCDVIQNKRDRSMLSQGDDENRSIWLREMCQEEEENVIVPVRLGVKETVKLIESTFKNPEGEVSPGRVRRSMAPQTAHEETQTEVFKPFSAPQHTDDVSNCLMQASESIQKLDEMFQSNQPKSSQPQSLPIILNKRIDTQTPKKITTKVMVNLKQISRRSSDVGHLKQLKEQARHSICNNAELFKRIQMHINSRKNDAISASCSSLATRPAEVAPVSGKCSKYFCRNCGFTMRPADVMQKIQSSGRLSIASSLAEGLQSIEGSQSMASNRRCLPISVSSLCNFNNFIY